MPQQKGNGKGVAEFATGSLIAKNNLKLIMVDTGANLQTEDDAPSEAVERALQIIQPLVYWMPSNTSGQIHCIVDASQFDEVALEEQLQAVGTDNVNSYDFSGAAVTVGTSFVVA
jgi:hypothetical protein